MILTEDYGNLQALSPEALKYCFKYCSSTDMGKSIGKNSVVKIIKGNELSNYLKKYSTKELPFIILRYKNVEKIYFYAYNYKVYSTGTSVYDRRWNMGGGLYIKRDEVIGLQNVYDNYKNTVPSFEDFLNKITYQLVFADKNRLQKQQQRKDNRGDILRVKKEKGYVTSDDWYRNQRLGIDDRSKVHGSIYDDRNTSSHWKAELEKRLKAYVESKFPSFNSVDDFANANIKGILKAFKIKGCVYKYDQNTTEQVVPGKMDPLYRLYTDKKSYIGYIFERYWDTRDRPKVPHYIFFELVLDINNNIKVSNIYGAESAYTNDFKPISDWFEKKEEKNNKNTKLSHDYNNDEDDDW